MVFPAGAGKPMLQGVDAIGENIGETQQHRKTDITGLQTVDDFPQIDALLRRCIGLDAYMAPGIDVEIAATPICYAVNLSVLLYTFRT